MLEETSANWQRNRYGTVLIARDSELVIKSDSSFVDSVKGVAHDVKVLFSGIE